MPGTIELYERLKPKLGEEEARDLIAYINESGKAGLVTREDLAALRTEMIERIESVRSELIGRIESVRSELTGRIESVRSELIGKIELVRSDLIKWMFLFWVGQIGAILGILFAFFRR